MSTPPLPPEPDWPSALGCYDVVRPVTRRAAMGLDPAGRPVWLHWSECSGDEDEPCGAEREYGALSINPSSAVPEVLDLVRQPARCWSVTEVVEGVSLAQAIAEGASVDVERVASGLLAALRRAHAAGWVHGDVKPANVMLRPDGSPVLVDWELATRVGRPSAPGSLGFAPPHAWEGGYRAETRNDTYMLAVLLGELLRGERLFTGDRGEVIAAQQAFRFASVEAPSPIVRHVFDAADAGVGAEAADLPLDDDALFEMRVDQVLRLSARGAASSIIAAVGRDADARVDTLGFDDQRAQLAPAAAERWRTSMRQNAVALEAVIGDGADGAEGLDEQRRRQRDRGRTLVARLGELSAGAVFVDSEAAAGALALIVGELERGLAEAGESWRVIRVTAGPAAEVSRGGVRGGVRDALQLALATSHVAGALCEAVVRAAPAVLGDALLIVAAFARDGGLVGSAGHVELAAGANPAGRRWVDDLDVRLSAITGAAPGAGAASDVDDPAAQAERLLLRGDALGAYPLLVRATTELLATDVVADQSHVRIADLWMEYGSMTSAAAVLDAFGAPASNLPVLRRIGRIAATLGDVEGIDRAVSAMRDAGCPPEDIELGRLTAALLLKRGELEGAHCVARVACRSARGTSDRLALAEAYSTWGLIARARGRLASSRRLLRVARSLADECGATRVALRIDANLLVAESSGDTGMSTAAAWADLGRRCARWGLHAPARRHLVRAASLFVAAADLDRGEEALRGAGEAASAGGQVAEVWAAMEQYLVLQLRARRDLALPAIGAMPDAAATRLQWWRGLATQMMNASLGPAIDLTAPTLPSTARIDAVRLSRVILRWVGRGGDSSARLARALRHVEGAYGSQSPAVGALSRLATRGAADDWPLIGLLAVLRDALEEDEAMREIALAFHASAFVWSGVADSTAAAWLRSHAPDIDEGRPFGIFAWEWRLAMLRADTILGHEPDVDARLESVLDALDAWAESMPAEDRARRLAVVPFASIALTVGLAPPDALEIPDGAEVLVAFRAHLRRAAVRFRGSRGRAAGLERVLHSALRLRSGCTVDEVLRETVSGVLAVCRAERAVVVFEDAAGDRRAKLATLERMEDVGPSDAEVSESAIQHARREGRACIFDDACGSAEFGDSPSVRLYRPRSLMIAPLQAHGETLGYLYVENRSLPKSFSQSDLQLLEGFASQAGLALDNARLVEELRSSLDELKRVRTEAVRAESLRVLGQMAGEVAHDFNNLLAVILGETQLLLQDRPDAGIERSLEVIERAAMDGAAAIRRIQSSTRARPREEFSVVDLGVLVREVLDFTRVRWASGGDPGRAVRTRCRSSRGVFVSGLAPELREVFTNLVLNAVDAMPEGGDLLVAVRAAAGGAEVEIRDTGSGIAPEIVDRVFDPFFSTKGEGGNGLGLAIAKEIVERHGGAIGVRSEVGRGTTIAVTLPLVEAPPAAAEESAALRPGREPVGAGESRSVLVVDDEEGVLRVLSTMLRAEGFSVTAAASGEEATRRLEGGERFDVVITDLYMPGTSGVEVIETTRRTAGARRVVVMSGYGDVVGEGRIARQSVDGVLAKPFTLADVRDVVG